MTRTNRLAPKLRLLPGALASIALLASCESTPSSPAASADHAALHASAAPAKGNGKSMEAAGLLKAVHAATARYNATEQARRNGYEEDDFCVSVPGLGTMGHHWANPALVDGTFDPLQPEVMLYLPDRNGKMKLVAVEYVVINTGSNEKPSFGDHEFDDGGTPIPAPHWSLHVWLYEDNPSGMFAPFNPRLSCPAP